MNKNFIDYVVGDDNSELARTKAELGFALHCLEREIAICARVDARNDALVKALEWIAANPGAHPANMVNVAKDALTSG